MGRVCAAQANATFLELDGPQLVGDGARKRVRRVFQEAKENAPCIIFIHEIDAIATTNRGKEVQRTMNELLNQLDELSPAEHVKVIAATNHRASILDPELMRSGRLDRKIKIPFPTEEARAKILWIHSREMTVHSKVNFEDLAKVTDGFNGAQLKAVCVEARRLAALRGDPTKVKHKDFVKGIVHVQAEKKASLNYHA